MERKPLSIDHRWGFQFQYFDFNIKRNSISKVNQESERLQARSLNETVKSTKVKYRLGNLSKEFSLGGRFDNWLERG